MLHTCYDQGARTSARVSVDELVFARMDGFVGVDGAALKGPAFGCEVVAGSAFHIVKRSGHFPGLAVFIHQDHAKGWLK